MAEYLAAYLDGNLVEEMVVPMVCSTVACLDVLMAGLMVAYLAILTVEAKVGSLAVKKVASKDVL